LYQNIYYDSEKHEVHLWDDEAGYSLFPFKRYAYINDDSGTFMSLKGKKCKKTGRWSKEDEEDGKVHEADINPETRVLVDNYLDSDEVSTNHKVMIIDIEVSMVEGLPDVKEALNEITAISFHNSAEDKYTALILDRMGALSPSNDGKIEIIPIKTEEALLSKFITMYSKISPTVLTGWNIDYFDIPYLFHRLRRVLGNDAACLLSPIGVVKWMPYRERYRLAGVSCLDYLALYKKFTFSREPTYNLDAISTKELGHGKIEYDGTLDTLYKTDIHKFLKYNINDVELVKEIDDKMKIIEIAMGTCHKGHVPYEDIFYSSRFLEGAMLVYMKKLNMVAPTKIAGEHDEKEEKFEGAYVKEPIPGRYEWVYDLDFQSLYPSIIRTLNVSPETKVGKIDGWSGEDYVKNVEKTHTLHVGNKTSKIDNAQLKTLLDEGKFSISSNGILYNTKVKGIIPAILETWFDERVEYRKMMKKYGDAGDKKLYNYFKSRQHVQKILLNSLYGVLGLPVFRFYDLDNAMATTLTGQAVIKYAEKVANYYYNKELGTDEDYVIYCDTDSEFLSALPIIKSRYPSFNVKDEEKMAQYVIEVATDVQKFINDSLNKFSEKFLNVTVHHFYTKQEKVGKSALWLTKKRYAMQTINDNGLTVDKMEVTGIDTVRSDFPPAFRTFLKELLTDILAGLDKKEIDNKILTFKRNIRILSLSQVAKPTSVNNVKKYTLKSKNQKHFSSNSDGFKNYTKGAPAAVKSAIMYNNLITYYNLTRTHKPIENAEKVRWVYLTENPFGIEAIAFKGYEDPNEIMDFIGTHINYEKMFDAVFEKKLDALYDAMQWTLPSPNEEVMNQFFGD